MFLIRDAIVSFRKKNLILIFVFLFVQCFVTTVSIARELPDFTVLVEKYSPAVVKIQVESAVPQMARNPRWVPDNMPQQLGLGSGFIIGADGYILTNHHVISGAEKITVRLNDRREFDAVVVGSDARSDIALLKINADKLPTLHFAADDDLKVGEWVLAIGSPFGLDYSVSQGIVSAIGRSLPSAQNENYVPFVQTDVAINPGNSGGPLFNLDGEVVGINSQIFTQSGGSMGLSFAIPASVARNVLTQLKDQGFVARGWLGVSIQEVDKKLAAAFGLGKPQGALVAHVIAGGPASEGGVLAGDVIIALNSKPILFSSDLPHQIGQMVPGALAELVLVRNGKQLELALPVGKLPEGDPFIDTTPRRRR